MPPTLQMVSDPSAVTVRTVTPEVVATIDLIARRMRLTLVEVLGQARADEMFDHAALVDSVGTSIAPIPNATPRYMWRRSARRSPATRWCGSRSWTEKSSACSPRLLSFYAAHGYECRRLDAAWATARRSLV